MENGKLNGQFYWSIDPTIPIATAMISGELDLTTPDVSELGAAVNGKTTGVLLDLSKVSFMDSTGLRRLIDLKQQLGARNIRLFISKTSPSVDNLLNLAGVSSFFDYTCGRPRSRWASFKEARSRKRVRE